MSNVITTDLTVSLSVVLFLLPSEKESKRRQNLHSEKIDLAAGARRDELRACLKDRMMSTGKENEGTWGRRTASS